MRRRLFRSVLALVVLVTAAVVLPQSPAAAEVRGPWQIQGIQSRKCVDVPNGTFNNVQLTIYTCKDKGNQLFYIQEIYNGEYNIWNIQTGKCLTVLNAETTNNTPVIQYACNIGLNELWTLPADLTIRNVKSGKCLTVQNNGTANGAKLLQFTCNGGQNQIFTWARGIEGN
ncbi:hypothetical protein Ais01nite_36760 [Asanoa ishikariensis]|uniref:RICIN domain-containing protein n=1 Tax=Asanoa ishikariensis TaxID=137265 RepID=UPI0015A285E6|nr:RICIN domain-containing protein [Asanoa ishikariensis]GIF65641.1 hypothetical protein Ais01nite_36760 [Asanoa ishikariensis]